MSRYPVLYKGSTGLSQAAGTSTAFSLPAGSERGEIWLVGVKGTSTSDLVPSSGGGTWTKLLRVSDEVNWGVEIWAGYGPFGSSNITVNWSVSQVRTVTSLRYAFGASQTSAPLLVASSTGFGSSTTTDPGNLAVPATVPGEFVLTGAIHGNTAAPTSAANTPDFQFYQRFGLAGASEHYLSASLVAPKVVQAHKQVLTITSAPWAAFALSLMPATVPGSFTPNMYKGRKTSALDLGATV